MIARVVPVEPFDLVVFGGTGDLARRKLLPALYHRLRDGQIPAESRIIGAARSELSVDAYRAMVREAIDTYVSPRELDTEVLEQFLGRLGYVRVDAESDNGWPELAAVLEKREGLRRESPVRVFYLAVDPGFFGSTCERLKTSGVAKPGARLVVEKPLGHDLASARALNVHLSAAFEEGCLYRIDHYLGKETVQNLMALRFANALFEPLWNSRHVDHVQITVAESIGVGTRGGYYDQTGAMRDMVQNHLMQLLCLTAMEPPNRFEPDAVRDEKLKVIKALEPMGPEDVAANTVRGQYRAGPDGPRYLDEVGTPASRTECYVALKARIANWRWSGTPFYLRTGKRLRAQLSEIAVVFKDTPHSIFSPESGDYRRNALIIRLQPDEAITLRMTIKEPGPGGMRLTDVPLDMTFAEQLGPDGWSMPDAYERLIMDVVRGDQTLFMRGDEVEAAWSWTDPIIRAWENSGSRPREYDPGSSGPEDALMLMHRDGRRWREIET
jgi:glucose-6-phosphate 1-dehydrogenase